MRIGISLGAQALGEARTPGQLVEEARQAEADGFASAWTVHFSRGYDALSVLAAAATTTERLGLGVGVVPTYPRHPAALAQQALTVQALCGGRLTLGVGVSHRPVVEGMHGLSYDRPLSHLREYLTVLGELVRTGRSSLQGQHYRVEADVTVPGAEEVPILVGALSAGTATAAGELADGVITWLAGPTSLERDIGPVVREAAAAAGRPEPQLVAALPVAVWDDELQARATADQVFARYGQLPNYRRLFEREGIANPGALAIVGDEDAVTAQLRRLADIGVTELWPITYPVVADGDRHGELRTRALLRTLAAQFPSQGLTG